MTRIERAIKELQRELSMRKQHYPSWIKIGKIKPQTAAERIEDIELSIEILKKTIPKQENLF